MTKTASHPERRLSKAERMAEEIRSFIALGKISAGDYLPPDREMAEQLATSRTTVSAALDLLAKEGLVRRAPGRGTYVASAAPARSMTIRFLHSLHPSSRLVWGEGLEIMRGVEETVGPLEFAYDRHCCITETGYSWPVDPCPTITLEASKVNLSHIEQLQRAGVPVVVANMEVQRSDLNATWTNHAEAMRHAVQLLLDMGHRRIAYLGRAPHIYFYGEAERSYVRTLQHGGVAVDPDLICHLEERLQVRQPVWLFSYEAAQHLLRRGNPPTAIVAARDSFAEGAWFGIEKAGLTVGRDVSLIGYDDLSWSSWHVHDSLTTFREPCYEMGAKAVELLVEQIIKGRQMPRQVELPSKLIMRKSVGPAPAR